MKKKYDSKRLNDPEGEKVTLVLITVKKTTLEINRKQISLVEIFGIALEQNLDMFWDINLTFSTQLV